MRKIVFFALLCIILQNVAHSQKLKKIRKVDSKAKTFESYEVLKDNKNIKHGKYLFRFKGNVQALGQYSNNVKSGEWIYTPDNNLKIVGSYFNDRKDGEWKYYSKDRLISIQNYSRGERIGKSIGYHENGKLACEFDYVDGKINGIRKAYYANGLLKSLINYKNGRFDGDYEMYSKNGELLYILTYKEGAPFNLDIKTENKDSILVGGDLKNGNGQLLSYNRQDERRYLSLLRTFKEGKLYGSIEAYNYRGELYLRGQYLKGYMVGMWTFNLNDPEKRKDIAYTYADSLSADSTKIFFKITNSYLDYAEDMPKFDQGSSDQFRSFISASLIYPKKALEQGIKGRIYTDFIINNIGELVEINITEGTNVYLEAEALRVLKSSPFWVPGFQDQIPVNVHFTFPIVFFLL